MNLFFANCLRIIFYVLLYLNAQLLAAQQVIKLKYQNGQPKIRYTIRANDTFCIENLLENGHPYSMTWRDSVHFFHPNQVVSFKTCNVEDSAQWIKIDWAEIACNRNLPEFKGTVIGWMQIANLDFTEFTEVLIACTAASAYFPNGVLHERITGQSDKLFKYEIYTSDGQLSETHLYEKQNDHLFKYQKINGLSKEVFITDTFAKTQERIYYKAQQKQKRKLYQYKPNIKHPFHEPIFTLVESEYYDNKSNLTFSWNAKEPQLHLDKDNGLCLYGLRNERDEWVVQPKYESIYKFNNAYFIANENGKYGVLNKNGEMLLPFQWDDLRELKIFNDDDATIDLENGQPPLTDVQLVYKQNGLYGVMDINGKIILKAHYQEIEQRKNDLYEIVIDNKWGIVNANAQRIVAPKYDGIQFTSYDDLFITKDSINLFDGNKKLLDGKKIKYNLVNAREKTLLTHADHLREDTDYFRCFWVNDFEDYKIGLFHADNSWLLDTQTMRSAPQSSRYTYHLPKYKILFEKDAQEQTRYGLLVSNMLISSIVLPFDYESITNCRKKNNEYSLIKQDLRAGGIADTLFLCEKANQQGIFDPRTQKWLLPLIYDAIYNFGDSLFLVSYDKKWQFMNRQGQKVLAETFDYGGTLSVQHPFNQDEWITNCFVVKNDSMFFYSETSFPNRSHLNDIKENNSPIKQQTSQRFHVKSEADNTDWYIDPNGKVLIAPDFHQTWEKDGVIVIRNPITNQQQIIDKQGNKQSFLSQYKIENMNIQDNWVLVRDTVTKRLGMMTVDQKVILPAQFFGMAHSEWHPVIWARADHPNLDSIKNKLYSNKNNKSNPLDSNWQLYDATGKLLTSVIFDYPFEWEYSVAVGQVRGKQGLWNHKGQNILPATYDAIWYDSFSHIFHLFKMQPDSSYRIGFANADGQVVIDANLFNMSIFTKNDAFVETEKGYGMIQKNGQYRIAPRPHALQQAPFPIRQWVEYDMKDNRYSNKQMFRTPYADPIATKTFLDTVQMSASKIQIENLLLEQTVASTFINKKFNDYQGIRYCYFELSNFYERTRNHNLFHSYESIENISSQAQTISFLIEKNHFEAYSSKCSYYNFQLKNNVWQNVLLEDVLFWNNATETALNALLFQKRSALKNEEMDCGNPNRYIQQVKNQFVIQTNGLLFLMPRHQYSSKDNIPLLLTWAELKSFLR